jgi:hypothetical protein
MYKHIFLHIRYVIFDTYMHPFHIWKENKKILQEPLRTETWLVQLALFHAAKSPHAILLHAKINVKANWSSNSNTYVHEMNLNIIFLLQTLVCWLSASTRELFFAYEMKSMPINCLQGKYIYTGLKSICTLELCVNRIWHA